MYNSGANGGSGLGPPQQMHPSFQKQQVRPNQRQAQPQNDPNLAHYNQPYTSHLNLAHQNPHPASRHPQPTHHNSNPQPTAHHNGQHPNASVGSKHTAPPGGNSASNNMTVPATGSTAPHHAASSQEIRAWGEQLRAQTEQVQQTFYLHKEQIEKLSRRVYDGLYQLIKIKFGISESHGSATFQDKYNTLLSDKLLELQRLAAQQQQQSSTKNQHHQGSFGHGYGSPNAAGGVGPGANNYDDPDYHFAQMGEELFGTIFPSGGAVGGGNGGNKVPQTSGQPRDKTNAHDMQWQGNPVQPADLALRKEQMTQTLQDQVEAEMVAKDKQLERSLVAALIQLDAHKQSLLTVIGRMKEQAEANERRQQKFVDLLLAHQAKQRQQSKALTLVGENDTDLWIEDVDLFAPRNGGVGSIAGAGSSDVCGGLRASNSLHQQDSLMQKTQRQGSFFAQGGPQSNNNSAKRWPSDGFNRQQDNQQIGGQPSSIEPWLDWP